MEGVGDVAAADVVDGEEVFLKEELLDGARYTGIDGAVAGGVINAGFAGEGAAVGVKFGVAQAEGQAGGGGAGGWSRGRLRSRLFGLLLGNF